MHIEIFLKFMVSQVHYNVVIMTTMASQITSLTVVYSTIYSDADQSKHQSSVNSPHKWPVKRKMYPVDDVIMSRVPLFTYRCTLTHEKPVQRDNGCWITHMMVGRIGRPMQYDFHKLLQQLVHRDNLEMIWIKLKESWIAWCDTKRYDRNVSNHISK